MKTLKEHSREFLAYRRILNHSPRTVSNSVYEIRQFINYLEEKHLVSGPEGITAERLGKYQKYLDGLTGPKGRPLTPGTVNVKIKNVRGFLKYLARNGQVRRDLAGELSYVRTPRKLPVSVFTHRQIRKALGKIDTGTLLGHRDRTVLELLYTSGLRASELTGVDVNDVDIDNGLITVMGKGSKQRIVPVGKTALRFLETYIRAVRPLLVKTDERRALFLSWRGKRLCRDALLNIVHKHCDNAGFDVNVTPHTFRRSCATEMIRADANLYHVKDLLGHENLSTIKSYVKTTILDLKKTHAKCHPREKDK